MWARKLTLSLNRKAGKILNMEENERQEEVVIWWMGCTGDDKYDLETQTYGSNSCQLLSSYC